MARVVRPSRNPSLPTIKPEPPSDLWQQLDKLAADHGIKHIVEAEPDYIWAAEWARRDGMAISTASFRLRQLQRAGVLEFVGIGINNVKYYRFKK